VANIEYGVVPVRLADSFGPPASLERLIPGGTRQAWGGEAKVASTLCTTRIRDMKSLGMFLQRRFCLRFSLTLEGFMKATVRKGFTLIEILIVVIILGILAAIVIPQFTNASEDAKLSAMQSTVQTVQSQIELFKLQQPDAELNADNLFDSLTTKVVDTVNNKTYGPYLQAKPVHPFANSTSVSSNVPTTDGWFFVDGQFGGVAKGTRFPKE